MKGNSRGVAQSWARQIQYERCRLEPAVVEKGQERRQNIIKYSQRNNKGIVLIDKSKRKALGNKF